jgi:hypothetical protein
LYYSYDKSQIKYSCITATTKVTVLSGQFKTCGVLAKQDSSKRVGVLAKTVLFVYSREPVHPKSVDKRVVGGIKYFTPHRIVLSLKKKKDCLHM